MSDKTTPLDMNNPIVAMMMDNLPVSPAAIPASYAGSTTSSPISLGDASAQYRQVLEKLEPTDKLKLRNIVDLSGDNQMGPVEFGFVFSAALKRGIRKLTEGAAGGDERSQMALNALKGIYTENHQYVTGPMVQEIYNGLGNKIFGDKFVPIDAERAQIEADRANELLNDRLLGLRVDMNGLLSRKPGDLRLIDSDGRPVVLTAPAAGTALGAAAPSAVPVPSAAPTTVTVGPNDSQPIGNRVPSAADLARSKAQTQL